MTVVTWKNCKIKKEDLRKLLSLGLSIDITKVEIKNEEANNNTIDKIISTAYGYKNFKFFRLRTLAILHKSYSEGSRKNIEKGKNNN